ncbi:hypothetical protein ZHS_55 [Edwardsiella phage vB_EpM_ZHS]|jgi:hypothetical protein|nr:hypothetical protein ZHS_55 [Edwardsiella phage vB_EpM_ZHS]
MAFLEFCAYGLLGLGALYLGVRLCSAAYFASKHEYETRMKRKQQ